MEEEKTDENLEKESPQNLDEDVVVKKQIRNLKFYAKLFFREVRHFSHEMLHIKEGTDIEGTIVGIKKDIVFKGHSVWILVASIFIASIGLNQNSTPVVIGAMLISPLMGPIVGIGLAVGTHDWKLLKRSLKFFAVAIVISILTSMIYFFITPIKDAHSELFARTQPTLLDVLIAIFGGLAGIVAGSRREKTNVIPGVAIATALMPPLCTAGYGLATAQYDFFFGAFYLFFINSFFISLTTVIVIKYLRFPEVNYVSPERQKHIRKYIFVFTLLVILPSGLIFWDMIKESRFHYQVEAFMRDNLSAYDNKIAYREVNYSDTLSVIEISMLEQVFTDAEIDDLRDKLSNYGLIKGKGIGITVTDSTALRIKQNEQVDDLLSKMDNFDSELKKREMLFTKQNELLTGKNSRIEQLEKELENIRKDTLPLYDIKAEFEIQYPEIERFAYAPSVECDTAGFDTIPTFLVKWDKRKIKTYQAKKKSEVLAKWLKVRLHLDTVRVVRF